MPIISTYIAQIYVEVERARLTRMLSKIREDEGKIAEAAEILQELQVETFGSMDKREKTDFILEQMRLTLAKRDYTRTQIISRKINTKFFSDPEHHVCTKTEMYINKHAVVYSLKNFLIPILFLRILNFDIIS